MNRNLIKRFNKLNGYMISPDLPDSEVLDQFYVTCPHGEKFRVLNLRLRTPPRDPAAHNTFMLAQMQSSAPQQWRSLSLDAVWFHWHFKTASKWPPQEALGAFWRNRMFCIEYESPWQPWSKGSDWPNKLDAHALWQACFDARRQKWLLQRLRLYDRDDKARR